MRFSNDIITSSTQDESDAVSPFENGSRGVPFFSDSPGNQTQRSSGLGCDIKEASDYEDKLSAYGVEDDPYKHVGDSTSELICVWL